MDWSSIYEEHGEEEGDWSGWASGRLAPVLESFSQSGGYTPLICYFFTINYILGVGCLGIPYAFLQSGVFLGSIMIVLLSFVAYITVLWVAETGHRDIQLRKFGRERSPGLYSHRFRKKQDYSSEKMLTIRSHGLSLDASDPTASIALTEFSALQSNLSNSSSYTSPDKRSNLIASEPAPRNFEEESEVLELVLRFLGPRGKLFYQSALMMLMFVGLIAYVQVFVNTFASQLWPGIDTFIPSLLFGLVAVPLSCVDLAEQISVQVLMSILRFLSLGILLMGTLVAVYVNPSVDSFTLPSYSSPSHSETAGLNNSGQSLPMFELHGFGLMFTTAIFSQLFQHSVPGLIRPLSPETKGQAPAIFGLALITTGAIYITTGVTCVYYFGPLVNQAINLNFVGFDWGAGQIHFLGHVCIKAMAMTVVLFPALDTLSVFPLIANTLGNNFHAAFPHAHKHVSKNMKACLSASMIDAIVKATSSSEYMSPREAMQQLTARLWRLAAAVPPIVLSMFIANLSLTLQVAGVCGILVALVTPALLQMYSLEQLCDVPCKISGTPRLYIQQNPYATVFSQVEYTYAVLCLATFALWVCCYQIVAAVAG
jgi:amino acid permease